MGSALKVLEKSLETVLDEVHVLKNCSFLWCPNLPK